MKVKRIGCFLVIAAFLLAVYLSGMRYPGKDGYIISNKNVSSQILAENLAQLDTLSDSIKVNICILPQKVDVLLSKKRSANRGKLWQLASENEHYAADVLPTLMLAANNGKYVYYRSDRRLTSLGSYYVYKSLGVTLGIDTYGAEDFTVNVVKSDFFGDEACKLLSKRGDRISLFRFEGDSFFVTEDMTSGSTYDGLYDFDKLLSEDAYSIFPISDSGYAKVTLGEGREKLLLLCDSYGDSIVPFLARHFDLDIVDPEFFDGSVKELIKSNSYTAALLCFGMDTLAGKRIYVK